MGDADVDQAGTESSITCFPEHCPIQMGGSFAICRADADVSLTKKPVCITVNCADASVEMPVQIAGRQLSS